MLIQSGVIKNLQVRVDRDALSYQMYALPYPRLEELITIKAAEIELVFAGYDGYQILLRNGNVVLFPREKTIALDLFVKSNNIPAVTGSDPWNLLTEPYLDQSYTAEETQRTIEHLGKLGFDPGEVGAIRKKVGPALFAYNFFVWEWVSMGLLEVLHTQKLRSESFYRWAISISQRGYRQARPCDLMKHRHGTGMDTVLWSRFEVLMRRQDLWPERPYQPVNSTRHRRRSWLQRWLSGPAPEAKPIAKRPPYKEWNPVYKWLFQQYSEPHRHYHNLGHLEQVLSLLESLQPEVSSACILAGWFHDSVYRPGASDNEQESAQQMEALCRSLDVFPKVLLKARELVLYTTRHRNTDDEDEKAIHDADLGVFGRDQDAYAKYAADVRQEYPEVPDDLFRKARRDILEEFWRDAQQRGRFYYVLDPIFERQVEANVRNEISARLALSRSLDLHLWNKREPRAEVLKPLPGGEGEKTADSSCHWRSE
jgi:predicted metal-dependent HD superfamily phosphohydrolase